MDELTSFILSEILTDKQKIEALLVCSETSRQNLQTIDDILKLIQKDTVAELQNYAN